MGGRRRGGEEKKRGPRGREPKEHMVKLAGSYRKEKLGEGKRSLWDGGVKVGGMGCRSVGKSRELPCVLSESGIQHAIGFANRHLSFFGTLQYCCPLKTGCCRVKATGFVHKEKTQNDNGFGWLGGSHGAHFKFLFIVSIPSC